MARLRTGGAWCPCPASVSASVAVSAWVRTLLTARQQCCQLYWSCHHVDISDKKSSLRPAPPLSQPQLLSVRDRGPCWQHCCQAYRSCHLDDISDKKSSVRLMPVSKNVISETEASEPPPRQPQLLIASELVFGYGGSDWWVWSRGSIRVFLVCNSWTDGPFKDRKISTEPSWRGPPIAIDDNNIIGLHICFCANDQKPLWSNFDQFNILAEIAKQI